MVKVQAAEPGTAGGACPRVQDAGNLDVEVESFGANPQREVVGEAAAVVGDHGCEVDRNGLGWAATARAHRT